jgi:CubicO group peptidase (beta-lactamase class C family)
MRCGTACASSTWGECDTARSRAWSADTLTNVWSTTKGALAASVARLVADGHVAYEHAVARCWPDFAAAGKDRITIAELFSHQGGLAGPSRPLTVDELFDVEAVAALLAAESPQWPVGSQSGYHALSIGYLAEALFRRVTGLPSSTPRIAAPLFSTFSASPSISTAARNVPRAPMSGGSSTSTASSGSRRCTCPSSRSCRIMLLARRGLLSAGGHSARSLVSAQRWPRSAGATRAWTEDAARHSAADRRRDWRRLADHLGYRLRLVGRRLRSQPAFGYHVGVVRWLLPIRMRLAVGCTPNFMREVRGSARRTSSARWPPSREV